jgi:two-component system, sensor histidine kinase LadS
MLYLKYLKQLLCLALCLLATTWTVFAQDSLQNVQLITEDNSFPYLNTYLFKAEDSTNKLTFEQIQQLDFQLVKIDTTKEYGFAIANLKTTWCYTKIFSKLPYDKDFLLFPSRTEKVEVYVRYADGKVVKKQTGQNLPTSLRDIKQSGDRVDFFLPKQQVVEIWVKCKQERGEGYALLRLLPTKPTYTKWFAKYFSASLLQGAFWIMILYNFLLFLIFRDRAYLYYCLYIVVAASFVAFIFIPEEFVFIGNNLDNTLIINVMTVGNVAIFYNLFVKHFVHLKKISVAANKFVNFYVGLRIFINFLLIVWIVNGMSFRQYTLISSIILVVDILSGLVLVFIISKNKESRTLNRFLLFGSLCLFIGGGIDTSSNFIDLPFIQGAAGSFFAYGVLVEIIIFSFGLAYRSRMVEKEKQQAQLELINQLQANEEMQQNINRDLERKVTERTAEIAHKNEELETQSNLLQEQKDHLQHAYTHITDSVKYAKRIQTALLPPKNKLQDLFPNSFIFYKPKDIVSGDFYFFANSPQNTDEIFFAVADCTGHGVPGAFMTVIGNNLLSKIIAEKQTTAPAQILTALDKGLLQTLQQQGVEMAKDKINDGMDIALVKINKSKQEIVLSSAKRVVYQFRNGELIEHEPNKFPIGSSHFGEKVFEQKTIMYQPKDVFYLFTDGYPDQFGGEENRKFMIKNFRNLLATIHLQPLATQEQVLQTEIDKWRGSLSQTDDILVVGFEV